jgi:hypothetical protein
MSLPPFVLCTRCSHAAPADDAEGWCRLTFPALDDDPGGDLDICPECSLTILEYLRSTP